MNKSENTMNKIGIDMSEIIQNLKKESGIEHTYICVKCGNPILDYEPIFMSRKELIKNAVKGFYHRLCLPARTTK